MMLFFTKLTYVQKIFFLQLLKTVIQQICNTVREWLRDVGYGSLVGCPEGLSCLSWLHVTAAAPPFLHRSTGTVHGTPLTKILTKAHSLHTYMSERLRHRKTMLRFN
jgi:hypothetical protein